MLQSAAILTLRRELNGTRAIAERSHQDVEWRLQELVAPDTSIILRLRARLNVYPPNRSTAAMSSSRNAASHRCGVPSNSGLPNITMSVTPNGTTDAIPSITPMNFSLDARSANGIERSWNEI